MVWTCADEMLDIPRTECYKSSCQAIGRPKRFMDIAKATEMVLKCVE